MNKIYYTVIGEEVLCENLENLELIICDGCEFAINVNEEYIPCSNCDYTQCLYCWLDDYNKCPEYKNIN